MKTKQQKRIEKRAYQWLFSYDNLIINRKPKFDMRFNESKQVLKLINKLKYTFNKDEVLALKKARLSSRQGIEFISLFNNPLVKDVLRHKHDVRHYNTNVVSFSDGRNHHAKNAKDVKIISIFKKHRNK